MKTNILSNSKTVLNQPNNKKLGLIDTITKISPVFLWLALIFGITATNIIAASIYVESKGPPPDLPHPPPPDLPHPPPPDLPHPPPPVIDIPNIPPKPNTGGSTPILPRSPEPILPEFSGYRFLVLIADTEQFRNREPNIVSELESFNKSVKAEKVKITYILVDAQGGRIWDISMDRVPPKKDVFSNEKAYESIHQVYQVRDKIIGANNTKVFSVILWGSDVNPDTLVGLNLGAAPAWPKLFVWYGHPDESLKLEEHLGSKNITNLKKELIPLSTSLQFHSNKLEKE
jgi:hypothetical protein